MASAEPGPGRGGRGVAARARATRARDRAFRVLMDHAHGFMASQVTPGPRGPHPLMACVTSDPTPSPAGVVRGLRAWRLRRPGRAGRGGRRGRGGGRELRPPGNAAAHGRLRGARAAEGGAGRLFLQHRTGVRLPGDGQPPVSARDAALPRGHDVPLLGAPGGRGKAGTSTRGPWASPLSKTHSPPSTGPTLSAGCSLARCGRHGACGGGVSSRPSTSQPSSASATSAAEPGRWPARPPASTPAAASRCLTFRMSWPPRGWRRRRRRSLGRGQGRACDSSEATSSGPASHARTCSSSPACCMTGRTAPACGCCGGRAGPAGQAVRCWWWRPHWRGAGPSAGGRCCCRSTCCCRRAGASARGPSTAPWPPAPASHACVCGGPGAPTPPCWPGSDVSLHHLIKNQKPRARGIRPSRRLPAVTGRRWKRRPGDALV
ncbi:collagen alpha-2(I) chain-like isoform X1 [Mastomys coucha]|uniref:collagen alpha-2(I) chain-like isoform X1 n=1 Tax=Mastomys coucha TaxID=35658 RepID=UPI0012625D43|nr:collagen alpha-2(I) chain-like isoform X1 [Mastomys coucha]